MGYSWDVQVRMVPLDGAEETLDLMSVMSDASGPNRVRLRYEPEIEEDENLNYRLVQTRFGYRVEVELFFDIVTMADHENLTTIANRLMDPRWTVYLSLDGGTTERVVLMDRAPSPAPLRGKTTAGARYSLGLQCRDLIDELVPIGSGSW